MRHLPRLHHRGLNVLLVEARRLAQPVRPLLEAGRVLVHLGELVNEGLRELGQVEVLVQPLADAVVRGEGAEDEGEGRGEAEDLLLGERLEVGAERRLDVAGRLAALDALEGRDEVARLTRGAAPG